MQDAEHTLEVVCGAAFGDYEYNSIIFKKSGLLYRSWIPAMVVSCFRFIVVSYYGVPCTLTLTHFMNNVHCIGGSGLSFLIVRDTPTTYVMRVYKTQKHDLWSWSILAILYAFQ